MSGCRRIIEAMNDAVYHQGNGPHHWGQIHAMEWTHVLCAPPAHPKDIPDYAAGLVMMVTGLAIYADAYRAQGPVEPAVAAALDEVGRAVAQLVARGDIRPLDHTTMLAMVDSIMTEGRRETGNEQQAGGA